MTPTAVSLLGNRIAAGEAPMKLENVYRGLRLVTPAAAPSGAPTRVGSTRTGWGSVTAWASTSPFAATTNSTWTL